MLTRRDFLESVVKTTAAIVPSFFLPPSLASDFWSQPRWLHLRRTATGEEVNVCFFANGQLRVPEYHQICHLLRDVKAGQAIAMDPVLLDILCGMQGWFRSYGQERVIQVNSGYRTPGTNSGLEGAAKNSLHMRGQAADIWFANVPTDYTAKVAMYLRGGGVGIYLSKNFCHIDKGTVRTWRG